MKKNLIKHKVLIDKYLAVDLFIPEELTALELKALMLKTDKLFKIGELQLVSETRQYHNWTSEEKKILINSYGRKTMLQILSLLKFEDTKKNRNVVYSQAAKLKKAGDLK